jgi:hypothetical protein
MESIDGSKSTQPRGAPVYCSALAALLLSLTWDCNAFNPTKTLPQSHLLEGRRLPQKGAEGEGPRPL